jgi:hypothetical protein
VGPTVVSILWRTEKSLSFAEYPTPIPRTSCLVAIPTEISLFFFCVVQVIIEVEYVMFVGISVNLVWTGFSPTYLKVLANSSRLLDFGVVAHLKRTPPHLKHNSMFCLCLQFKSLDPH